MCLQDIVLQNGVDEPTKERLLFDCTSDRVCLEFNMYARDCTLRYLTSSMTPHDSGMGRVCVCLLPVTFNESTSSTFFIPSSRVTTYLAFAPHFGDRDISYSRLRITCIFTFEVELT